jgi:uncharacterized protein (TIRG00374 family)
MQAHKVAWCYGLIFIIYLIIFFVIDKKNGLIEDLPIALAQLPTLMTFALISYGLRYFRWFLMLRWAGSKTPFWRGWLAYLSGFAFTATPGKVGELLRIRYYGRLNISATRVTSAFVFERSLDLVVVFCLASLWVVEHEMLVLAATFIGIFLLITGILFYRSKWLETLSMVFATWGWIRLSKLVLFVAKSFSDCRVWMSLWPLLISFILGFAAWSITAFAFVYLLDALSLNFLWMNSFSIYPLAMLAGAASMLPGGVGSTEAAIVVQLKSYGVPISTAVLAAMIIRLGTMWFSVFCGFFAIFLQEIKSGFK